MTEALVKYVDGGLRRLVREDAGQTLVEYGLILLSITVAMLLVLAAFQGSVQGLYDSINSALTSVIS
jgi:Flp pilus assembly pilin Flp